jgi:hypothetical protein
MDNLFEIEEDTADMLQPFWVDLLRFQKKCLSLGADSRHFLPQLVQGRKRIRSDVE